MGSASIFGWVMAILLYIFFFWFMHYRKNQSQKQYRPQRKKAPHVQQDDPKQEKERQKGIEYPSYNFSTHLPLEAKYANSNIPNIVLIERYTYNDLKGMIANKNIPFFEKVANAVISAYKAKLEIYNNWIINSQGEIDNIDIENTPQTSLAHNEHYNKHTKIIKRSNYICDEINNALPNITPSSVYQDYRDILWHPKYGFENIVGRSKVKDSFAEEVFEFVENYSVCYTGFKNRLITGPSGSGKSTIAESIAMANGRSGMTVLSSYQKLSKDDFESVWVGGTTGKVADVFINSLEESLNADEFNKITDSSSLGRATSYGDQAINMIVEYTNKFEGLTRLNVIGYEKQIMANFMGSDEGTNRRFPHRLRIKLEPYTIEELATILIRYLIHPGKLDIGKLSADIIYSAIKATYEANKDIFILQASSVVQIGEYILATIRSAKNLKWIPNDDSHNSKILLLCYNDYMRKFNKIHLVTDEDSEKTFDY